MIDEAIAARHLISKFSTFKATAMMNTSNFRKHAHELVDWMADFLENIESFPVKSPVTPGEIIAQLPENPPDAPQPFSQIMADFQHIIVPGMTHWQHPNFHAYFPANSSPPSVLAEMLTATLGAQCMIWQTSPAAAELEERMMHWLQQMTGLPENWHGIIQDTASSATLCSILTAREQHSRFAVNQRGFSGEKFVVYCSEQTHSSIDKAVKIAGIGSDFLRKIPVDDAFAMRTDALAEAIAADIAAGLQPLCVVASIGTTGSTAIDPLRKIGEICRENSIWLHVDAAFAGTALLLPECRGMIDGIELADTFVFNPHKWMFTNFDCSAYFVKDKGALIQTFEILPEYLKTSEDNQVNNYRDWGIALGRRFRALKLWFVIRTYGVRGLQAKIREHIRLAQEFVKWIENSDDFELLAPAPLNTVCFRFHPQKVNEIEALNQLNSTFLEKLNATGEVYLTHTKLNGKYTLRMVIGQTNVEQRHVEKAWQLIREISREL